MADRIRVEPGEVSNVGEDRIDVAIEIVVTIDSGAKRSHSSTASLIWDKLRGRWVRASEQTAYWLDQETWLWLDDLKVSDEAADEIERTCRQAIEDWKP